MRRTTVGLGVLLIAAACGSTAGSTTISLPAPTSVTRPVSDEPAGPATVVLGGDVMLGRRVGEVAAADPSSVFEEVRYLIGHADLAVANLESPLTTRTHAVDNPNALEADPALAVLLAGAGFDAMGIANNHAADAGPGTVADTVEVLTGAGLQAAGLPAAAGGCEPVLFTANGVRIALLAFDATGQGAGVAAWDAATVRDSVDRAREEAEVVIVGIHGGIEYLPSTDRTQQNLAETLAGWGVDIVWGHHPHTVQPLYLTDPDGDGRPTLVATSLGNLLFDQTGGASGEGVLLEAVVAPEGAIAYRLARTEHHDLRIHLQGWDQPSGDAVLLDGEWWSPVRPLEPVAPAEVDVPAARFDGGEVVDATLGDADGDGTDELVVAFRRPYADNPVTVRYPGIAFADRQGRSAHLGVYGLDLSSEWVAGTLFRPVAEVAACDGALAVAYSGLDDPAVVGTGGWRWDGFGFVIAPDLDGFGRPGCADVDGDGDLDPIVLERTGK